jgi:hypothetical protein
MTSARSAAPDTSSTRSLAPQTISVGSGDPASSGWRGVAGSGRPVEHDIQHVAELARSLDDQGRRCTGSDDLFHVAGLRAAHTQRRDQPQALD